MTASRIYKILDGVHRCVAAHRCGFATIFARIDRDGALSESLELPLADLVSSKSVIGRWDRGRDFQDLVEIVLDELTRSELLPIVVSEIDPISAKYFSSISLIDVTDDAE